MLNLLNMRNRRNKNAMVGAFALLIGFAGQPAHAGELPPLVVEGVVHAPIADVWDAFYDEDKRKWMTPECSIDMEVGGLIKCSYIPGADLDGEHAIHHKIIAVEPGRRMVSELVQGPTGFPHTEAMMGSLGIFELDPIGAHATKIRSVITGMRDDEAGKAAYAYFEQGNAFTFDGVKNHLEHPDLAQRTARAQELLADLAGGEWIHEGAMPDGNTIRVRNVIRMGPDGVSVVSNGWLGFGDGGMFDHGPTVVWTDQHGLIRFHGVHETGATGSGTVHLVGDDGLDWDWLETSPDGGTQRYAIGMRIVDEDLYVSSMEVVGEDGSRTMLADGLEYRRVDVAPEQFRTLTTGEVLSAHTAPKERTKMSDSRQIEITATIPASVDSVWDSWTTSEGMTAFIGANANIELRRGGPFELEFDETAEPGSRGSETCEIISYVPKKMLSFTWNAPPHFENVRFIHTWVVVEFEAISDDRTQVTLTHAGWDENREAHPEFLNEWDGAQAYFESAWPRVLGALQSYHEQH